MEGFKLFGRGCASRKPDPRPTMTLSLTLLRHCQTEANARDLLCGRANVPLSTDGARQALTLGRQLGTIPWARIVSSPLRRARDTARAIAKVAAADICIDHRLLEIDYGDWEGRSISDLWQVDLRFQRFRADPECIAPPGGETILQVAKRAQNLVHELEHALALGHLSSGPVLMVSHKTTIRILASVLAGIPLGMYRTIECTPGRSLLLERSSGFWAIRDPAPSP